MCRVVFRSGSTSWGIDVNSSGISPYRHARADTYDPAKPVALLAAASVSLALFLPMLGGDGAGGDAGTLADGGSQFVAYVLIGVALMLIGTFAMPRGSAGIALAGGAGTVIGGMFGFMATRPQLVHFGWRQCSPRQG